MTFYTDASRAISTHLHLSRAYSRILFGEHVSPGARPVIDDLDRHI
jgi:hypothetical protein